MPDTKTLNETSGDIHDGTLFLYSKKAQAFCQLKEEPRDQTHIQTDERFNIIKCVDTADYGDTDDPFEAQKKRLTDKLNRDPIKYMDRYGFSILHAHSTGRDEDPLVNTDTLVNLKSVSMHMDALLPCTRHNIFRGNELHPDGEVHCTNTTTPSPFVLRKTGNNYNLGHTRGEKWCGVDHGELACRKRGHVFGGNPFDPESTDAQFKIYEARKIKDKYTLKRWSGF